MVAHTSVSSDLILGSLVEKLDNHIKSSELYYAEGRLAIKNVEIIKAQQDVLTNMLTNLSYLPELVAETKKSGLALLEIKDTFVNALTGKKHMTDDTFKILMRWIVAPVLLGLMALIIFLVIGNTTYTNRTVNYKSERLGALSSGNVEEEKPPVLLPSK